MSAYQVGVACAQQRKPVWWVRERTRLVPRPTARGVEGLRLVPEDGGVRTFRFRAFGLDARREHEFTFGVEARDEEQAWLRACAYVGSIDFCCHGLDLLEG